MKKTRIDLLLVEKGLVESRSLAQRLVMAGQVRADGQVVPKPSSKVVDSARIELDRGPRFVSRGGEKLAAALEAFPVPVGERICADVGASTGGFTDCLLQHGAMRVFAIDVGHGIFHWKLRNNPRVVLMERTNARFVEKLPEPVGLVTLDASFISLKVLLPVISGWLPLAGSSAEAQESGIGEVIALIKPQFEAGRRQAARGQGVIRDPQIHRQVLLDVLGYAQQAGFGVKGLIRSPLKGPKGNVEFLTWLEYPAGDQQIVGQDLSDLITDLTPDEGGDKIPS